MTRSIYDSMSDDEFVLQSDVPEILALLRNGGPYTRAGLRFAMESPTRPSQFIDELKQLVKRGFATQSGEDFVVTPRGRKPR